MATAKGNLNLWDSLDELHSKTTFEFSTIQYNFRYSCLFCHGVEQGLQNKGSIQQSTNNGNFQQNLKKHFLFDSAHYTHLKKGKHPKPYVQKCNLSRTCCRDFIQLK